jgi:L-galactono-1,4-lactone dehydrogenase
MSNWSSTHTSRIYEPESSQEAIRVLQLFHEQSKKIRPIGTGLSPNGIAFGSSGDAQISLTHLDAVSVDPINRIVTAGSGQVRSGARVSEVLGALQSHGLTLENCSRRGSSLSLSLSE